ncbi:cytochrome c3 family protein [Shewanella putrefaciens]|uniref:cytochrome c3 family protein n=1 Tax=Shewanella putrefaciens TaxID=24 RepID=UPI003562CA66
MHKKLKLTLLTTAVLCFANIAVAKTIKPHHKEADLSCNSCHVSKPFESVPMEQCLACHELPQKKEDYHGAPDKHDSPHYGTKLECENCHAEHEASENYCNNCHEFDFKVP